MIGIRFILAVLMTVVTVAVAEGQASDADIQRLNRHFINPDESIEPWLFIPKENIHELDTHTSPGLLKIRQAGKNQDIKGILSDPIKFDDFSLPWYFQLCLLQNQNAVAGHTGSRTQINYAIGINLAVTFSDPKLWPSDRTQRPPDTHDVQLFVVHLGASGEVTQGLPQYTNEQHPERWLVWGRGDLGYSCMGDWRLPYMEVGNGMKVGGPASSQVYFQCYVQSPTSISIGIKFNETDDYHTRWIDFASLYGPAAGIWEVGPIFSCDRWIPDVLCRNIAIERPYPFLFGSTLKDGNAISNWITIPQPRPEAPPADLEHLIDYCVFGSFAGKDLESFSSDFDIPGYLGKGRFQLYSAKMDTYSHPGYLTLTKMGRTLECFAWGTPGVMDFDDFKPPWEIEACVITPDDKYNWDFDIGFAFLDKDNNQFGCWYPGVRNLPRSGRYEYFSLTNTGYKIEFDPPLPQSLLAAKPIYMLVQFIDKNHVRLGFKAKSDEPWTMSKICEWSGKNGESIQKLLFIAWNASTSTPPAEELVGFPLYQQYRFDYIHYRYGLTTDKGQSSNQSNHSQDDMIYIQGGKANLGLTSKQIQEFAAQFGITSDVFYAQSERTAEVKPFLIDKYEVTNCQYRQFIEQTGYRQPINWTDCGYPESRANQPVTCVNYQDALAYAKWKGKRLPAEEEWELAAGGFEGRLWPWGDKWSDNLCRTAKLSERAMNLQPSQVGSYPKDCSPFGVMDMGGNVSEWVNASLPENVSYTAITKGGSFAESAPFQFLCSKRNAQPKGNGDLIEYIGFRCVKDADGLNVIPETNTADITVENNSSKECNSKLDSNPSFSQTSDSAVVPEKYLSEKIKFLPVESLSSQEASYYMAVYLSQCKNNNNSRQLYPYRIEISVPYLPKERFTLLFENCMMAKAESSLHFNEEATEAVFESKLPGDIILKAVVTGNLNTVDIDYTIQNKGNTPNLKAQEMCFQLPGAPQFRDHDGNRTFLLTEDGIKSRAQLWRHLSLRKGIDDYKVGEKPADMQDGPRIAASGMAVVSQDAKWTVGLTSISPPMRLANNLEYSCLHCDPVSSVSPGETIQIKQRIYFLKGTLKEQFDTFKRDIKESKKN